MGWAITTTAASTWMSSLALLLIEVRAWLPPHPKREIGTDQQANKNKMWPKPNRSSKAAPCLSFLRSFHHFVVCLKLWAGNSVLPAHSFRQTTK